MPCVDGKRWGLALADAQPDLNDDHRLALAVGELNHVLAVVPQADHLREPGRDAL